MPIDLFAFWACPEFVVMSKRVFFKFACGFFFRDWLHFGVAFWASRRRHVDVELYVESLREFSQFFLSFLSLEVEGVDSPCGGLLVELQVSSEQDSPFFS